MTSSVAADWGLLHGVNPTGKEIGRGAYGRVFEVDYEGTLCAAKEVHALLLQYAQGDDLQKIKDNFLNECQIWSTLRHPCVVQFLGVYYPAVDQYRLPVMVMEKMQQSLRGLVEKYNNIPLDVKLSILDEVCLGLRYLHSRNPPIVHRDLTPNNILLGGHLEAKITDLGVAKVMRSDNQKTLTKLPGTPDFMPPEALSKRPVYGPSLDVFSYGGIILNVTTQLWPEPTDRNQFNPDTNVWEVISEVKRRQQYLDEMTGGAADLKPLVMSCLDDNPNNRPPVAQISMTIKRVKDVCSENSRDGMSPIIWWAEVSNEQQSQVTSSLTTALEEIEQLKGENDALKTDNTQLKTNNDAMKDKIDQLKFEVDMIKAKNAQLKIENGNLKGDHVNTSTSLHPPPVPPRRHKLKESTTPVDLFSGPVNIKWEQAAPTPVGRFVHTVVWVNGLVYVGGGYEIAIEGSRDSFTINSYDPVSDSWSSINTGYCHFAMTALNNKLLIAGGKDRSYNKTNEMFTLNRGDYLKSFAKMTRARFRATAAGHKGMLIITGGYDDKNQRLTSIELLDSSSCQWYTCGDLPQPHTQLQSVIVDNTLYLLGGYNKDGGSRAVFTASLDSLSRHQLKWNTHQDTPCYGSAPVSVCDTHLLIVGGCKINKFIPASEIYKFDKVNHSWEAIGNIPTARHLSTSISIADNKVILIGGKNDKGQYTKTVWIGTW